MVLPRFAEAALSGGPLVVHDDGRQVTEGLVDVGKRLRPNRRGGQNVLFVDQPDRGGQRALTALKLP